MVFSSLVFLYFFLPVTILLYYAVPRHFRNPVLLLTSLVFYGWGEPVWISIMLFSSVLDYICSNRIERHRDDSKICRRALMVSVICNLGVLFVFKYTGKFELPIGISFYTFQTMSCTIDVYRGESKAQRKWTDFATYVTLFPQLIAGPIVRYRDIDRQLTGRRETVEKMALGITVFCVGLSKKVLLANSFGALWSQVQDRGTVPILTAVFGICCYAFQIYFDFSGYSDMAVGLGRMFGFELPVNFNYPYLSQSVTEFWRRWHITLGTWFREYVYIPLGGSREGRGKMIRNILIVWFLTGLWHGAGWNFVLWGLWYGFFLMIEKMFLLPRWDKVPGLIRHIYTMTLVLGGWAIFVSDSSAVMTNLLGSLTGAYGVADRWLGYELVSCGPLILAGILGCTPVPKRIWGKITARAGWLVPAACTAAMIVCTAYLVNSDYNPFLYFRF